MRFFIEKTESMRNFANKLWNAARFIQMNKPDKSLGEMILDKPEDKWIVSLANNLAREVSENIDKYELGVAFGKIYDFVWSEFCDWYIEIAKSRIIEKDESVFPTLLYVLEIALKCLHPFMPFITEEIYSELYQNGFIAVSDFPKFNPDMVFEEETRKIENAKMAIREIRNLRAQMNVPPSKKVDVKILADNEDDFKAPFFAKLAYAKNVIFVKNESEVDIKNSVLAVTPNAKIFMLQSDLVDLEAEKKRIAQEKIKIQKEIDIFEKKLSNENFTNKAPKEVIEEAKQKLANYKEMLEKIS
jgi:valyl-tRNA synthetase